MSRYMIAGGQEGKDRLDVQSAAYRPSTLALLQRADLETGWRCLDVGYTILAGARLFQVWGYRR